MKGWRKKLGALCLTAALATCALTACTPAYENYELELVSKPTMTVQSFDEKTGTHTILIEGWAGNATGMILLNAQAAVYFYDEFGDPLETQYAYTAIEGIDVDEVWHYYMLVETEVIPTDFEVYAYGYNW